MDFIWEFHHPFSCITWTDWIGWHNSMLNFQLITFGLLNFLTNIKKQWYSTLNFPFLFCTCVTATCSHRLSHNDMIYRQVTCCVLWWLLTLSWSVLASIGLPVSVRTASLYPGIDFPSLWKDGCVSVLIWWWWSWVCNTSIQILPWEFDRVQMWSQAT